MPSHPAYPILTVAVLCAASQSALATSRWTFGCGTTGLPACGATVGATQQYAGTNTTNTARVSGWANNGSVGDLSQNRLASASVVTWGSGLGVRLSSESGSPNHAIDSSGPDEFVLVSFAQAVNLASVGVGWFSGDFDISVLALTGTGSPNLTNNTLSSADLAGGATAGLVNAGWTLVGNRSNASAVLSGGSHNFSINTAGVTSSHWLIGAYNTSVGGTNEGWTTGDDFFKLLHVGGTTSTGGGGGSPVPVPGTLALLALGLPFLRRHLAKA